MSSERIGSSFEEFLEDEGIRDDVDAIAQKRVFAWLSQQAEKTSSTPIQLRATRAAPNL